MTEQGDLRAPEAGLRELEHAEELLQQGTLPPEEADRLGKRHHKPSAAICRTRLHRRAGPWRAYFH